MSEKINGEKITKTAKSTIDDLVADIINKNLGIKGESEDGDSDKGEFVTKNELKTFGDTLTKAIGKSIDELKDLVKTVSANNDDGNDATNDDNNATNDKDTKKINKSNDNKSYEEKVATAVGDVLEKMGIKEFSNALKEVEEKSMKKSYVLDSNNKLIKGSDDVDGTHEIDVNTISEEEFNALPVETKNSIMGSEFRNRLLGR